MKTLYRGIVTRVDTNGAWVEIPHIATGHDFGPCQVPSNLPLMTSDRVLVGKIEEIDEDFVIVAKIANTGESPYPAGHNHDDRYYTEVESDGRYYTKTQLNNGQLDNRYYTEAEIASIVSGKADQVRLAAGTGVTQWLRVATVNGGSAQIGTEITLMIAGQGSIGQAQRATDIVTIGQRGDNGFAYEAWHFGSTLSPWSYFYKQISTYVFELWARRTGYDSNTTVTVLSRGNNATLNLDSATTTDPGAALTSLPIPVNVDQISRNAVVRIVHGSNANTARPIWAPYVEWLGSVQPNNMTANDTWVNNSP